MKLNQEEWTCKTRDSCWNASEEETLLWLFICLN